MALSNKQPAHCDIELFQMEKVQNSISNALSNLSLLHLKDIQEKICNRLFMTSFFSSKAKVYFSEVTPKPKVQYN